MSDKKEQRYCDGDRSSCPNNGCTNCLIEASYAAMRMGNPPIFFLSKSDHELFVRQKSTIDRLRHLAEHVVLSYDNGDRMTGFTLQEKYLAKEFLRIMEEEESK